MRPFTSLIIAAAAFLSDRSIKELVDKQFTTGQVKSLAGGKICIEKTVNRGFALNKLEGKRKLILTVSSAIFIMLLLSYCTVLVKPAPRGLRLGYALLAGGAAGNFYDRWKKEYVVDYINLSCMKKIVFNLADVFIVSGALLSALTILIAGR